jgi:hypothetical protein
MSVKEKKNKGNLPFVHKYKIYFGGNKMNVDFLNTFKTINKEKGIVHRVITGTELIKVCQDEIIKTDNCRQRKNNMTDLVYLSIKNAIKNNNLHMMEIYLIEENNEIQLYDGYMRILALEKIYNENKEIDLDKLTFSITLQLNS